MTSVRVLVELVIVLGSAAIVTVGFQALRLPVALGYVLAGLVIGPHVPVPLVADAALVHVLSELGVIFLMFTIGLELPLATIMRHGLPAALTALFEVGLAVTLGTLVARLVGLPPTLSIIMGACLGISSTMLVAKAFDELGWKGGFTELVFAILVFEDVIAIVLLAVVTALASGAGLDATHLAHLLGKLGGFLAVLLVVGLLVVPRVIRWVADRAQRETLVITSLLICFGAAALAAYAGFSVALGAFIAGVLIAESGKGEAVAHRVETLRDVFTMIFFVSIGMSIEPAALWTEAPRILVLALVVLVTKPLGVATGTFLAGNGVGRALRTGLSLAQIGEFSFVIAGVSGSPQLLAIAVGVSCVTTLVSPLLIRNSERIAGSLAHRLPAGVATFVSFYESWLAGLRARSPTAWPRYRKTVLILAFDAGMVGAIVILGSAHPWLLLAAAPFAIDTVRRVAVLARRLANDAVPDGGAVDLGRAARRALVLTFELAFSLAIIVPIVAIVQPFVPASFALVLVIALGLVLVMRRRIADFEGHVRASSELILELLRSQPGDAPLAQVSTVLPGFANTASLALPPDAHAVGRSLTELDLRGKTGATVLAIVRGETGVVTPSPDDPLCAGDVLALAGSDEALAAARALLLSPRGAA